MFGLSPRSVPLWSLRVEDGGRRGLQVGLIQGFERRIRETQGLGGTWVVARSLAAEPQPADHGAVAVDVIAHEVREQPPALADQLEQAAARVVVVLVRAQMFGE